MTYRPSLKSRLSAAIAALAVLALFHGPARAVDGVVLIDQNRALAGSVTPGDTPDFPITISQPGSYRLSSNLSCVLPCLAGIFMVTAPNVTIDLNGFSISGPSPRTAVYAAEANFTLKNGSILGFGLPDPVLALGSASVLQDLYIRNESGGPGLLVPPGSLVLNVRAGATNLLIGCPSVVANSVFRSVSFNTFLPDSTRCTVSNTATLW